MTDFFKKTHMKGYGIKTKYMKKPNERSTDEQRESFTTSFYRTG